VNLCRHVSEDPESSILLHSRLGTFGGSAGVLGLPRSSRDTVPLSLLTARTQS
jgi:hypothetical protein